MEEVFDKLNYAVGTGNKRTSGIFGQDDGVYFKT